VKNPPEYRTFRQIVAAIYIAITGVLCVCCIVSTFVGAHARMAVAPAPAPLSQVDDAARLFCMRELDVLSTELNDRLDATLASWPARRSSVEWEDWSPAWRERLLKVAARCRLDEGDAPGTADLRVAFLKLAQLHRHYTTLAVQFSKEIGPYADGLHQAMEKARRSSPVAPP
jgi:hypothetical protein